MAPDLIGSSSTGWPSSGCCFQSGIETVPLPFGRSRSQLRRTSMRLSLVVMLGVYISMSGVSSVYLWLTMGSVSDGRWRERGKTYVVHRDH